MVFATETPRSVEEILAAIRANSGELVAARKVETKKKDRQDKEDRYLIDSLTPGLGLKVKKDKGKKKGKKDEAASTSDSGGGSKPPFKMSKGVDFMPVEYVPDGATVDNGGDPDSDRWCIVHKLGKFYFVQAKRGQQRTIMVRERYYRSHFTEMFAEAFGNSSSGSGGGIMSAIKARARRRPSSTSGS